MSQLNLRHRAVSFCQIPGAVLCASRQDSSWSPRHQTARPPRPSPPSPWSRPARTSSAAPSSASRPLSLLPPPPPPAQEEEEKEQEPAASAPSWSLAQAASAPSWSLAQAARPRAAPAPSWSLAPAVRSPSLSPCQALLSSSPGRLDHQTETTLRFSTRAPRSKQRREEKQTRTKSPNSDVQT